MLFYFIFDAVKVKQGLYNSIITFNPRAIANYQTLVPFGTRA